MTNVRTINDINRGVELYSAARNAVLLDVRTRDEYIEGHVPGSMNIPLMELRRVEDEIAELDRQIFVYCLSGGRSWQAAAVLEQMGYENVTNIGGISDYKGAIEK